MSSFFMRRYNKEDNVPTLDTMRSVRFLQQHSYPISKSWLYVTSFWLTIVHTSLQLQISNLSLKEITLSKKTTCF